MQDLKALIEHALADKQLTRSEQQAIMNAVLADQQISDEEHMLLDRIVEMISTGEIQAVDN